MQVTTLDILRCPYCGGRLEVVPTMYQRRDGDEIQDAVLGCHCCIFPVVSGIPVLHLLPAGVAARQHIEAARPELALRAMINLEDDERAARVEAAFQSATSTYKELVDALGPSFEGGYLLYRFSDPTYLVGHALLRAVAGTVLHGSRRAVDICGGTGPMTRLLMDLSAPTPIVADLYFAKVWLARRFVAPGCEAVCCDGNAPLPFARGAFGLAMCSDAFQYIWTKRQFIGEMARLVDGSGEPGAVVINHTHNQETWSASHGQPLPPAGYRALFETIEPRIFSEAGLLADVVNGGPLDLSRRDPMDVLNADPALTIVATRHDGVFQPHALEAPTAARGEYRVNPLYEIRQDDGRLDLRLRFPSADYEDEFGACRRYMPEQTTIDRAMLQALQLGGPPGALTDLIRRRVIVDLPKRYY